MSVNNSPAAIVIGTSAGGVEALSAILPSIPTQYHAPVFVVIHLPPDRRSAIAELMADKCAAEVCEAEDKEPIRNGVIYFAPPDYHLLVEDKQTLSLSVEPPVHFSRPSIDVLFETAAEVYGKELTAIILTGANDDGAEGSQCVIRNGGTLLVQNPRDAFSPAMPEAALKLCPAARIMSLKDIAAYFANGINSKK